MKKLLFVFALVLWGAMLAANAQNQTVDLSIKAGTTITKTSPTDTGDGQVDHLSLIYDFDGLDFDYTVSGMVGTNDSLYILCDSPNRQGLLFRIDENGDGYNVIWEFDAVNKLPFSLLANDTIIYGTTRFSSNGGGTLFKYCLKDYTFEFIKDFNPTDVQEVQIKYITDSVLWFSSLWSYVDEGSIFTLEKDGTQLNKIYNDTNADKGQNPVDFDFHNDSIYIAFYNGGGVPYPDATGSYNLSGSFVRIKSDGTGYENLIKGGDTKGTQPQSLIIRENKLIGLFAYSGSQYNYGGQFFRCDLDGSSYDSLGALSGRALTKMLSTDSLIYGISLSQFFGVNPFNGEIRIFDDLLSNPDWGYDVVSNPAFLNGYVFVATQQGGPDGGGTILRWTNQAPLVNEENNKGNQSAKEIVLSKLFIDPEGDSLTYVFDYNADEISVVESNSTLTLTLLKESEANIDITASDGWTGYRTYTITLSPTTSIINPNEKASTIKLFPNPANSVLMFDSDEIELIEIYNLNGKLINSFRNPKGEINISSLENGLFIVKYLYKGKFYSQRIVKY